MPAAGHLHDQPRAVAGSLGLMQALNGHVAVNQLRISTSHPCSGPLAPSYFHTHASKLPKRLRSVMKSPFRLRRHAMAPVLVLELLRVSNALVQGQRIASNVPSSVRYCLGREKFNLIIAREVRCSHWELENK